MQQNPNNLTEENPYSSPISTDFRLPEKTYKPHIVDKLLRIFWGIWLLPLLISVFALGINLFLYPEMFNYIQNEPNLTLLSFCIIIFIAMFLITIIPNLIFLIIIEKFGSTITKKIICSFVYSICVITMFLLLRFVFDMGVGFSVVIGAFILSFPSAIITALILHAHYKYYEKRYFRQPERNKK